MRSCPHKSFLALVVLSLNLLFLAGCENNFYLSEKEVAAYNSVLVTQDAANLHFDNLQGRALDVTFDNSTGTPHLQSTNLLAEMRRTEMAQLETGPAAVTLERLSSELETQIGKWIEGRLQLYTSGSTADTARLTRLDSVRIVFLNNPTFTYRPERQAITFDVRFEITITGTIEVNAVSWLINIFSRTNGTYPLQVVIPDLRLQGDAAIYSPLANAGRIRFQIVPQIMSPIRTDETGTSVPGAVRDGVAEVMTHNLSVPIDEVFEQEYDHFAMPNLRLTADSPSRLEVSYRSKADWLGPDAARPQMHIVTRAFDGNLYHARKSNSGWSSYSVISFPRTLLAPDPQIENDPALIHSGNNQLELAATDRHGDLVYAHYRDETWGNWQIFRPNSVVSPPETFVGKPAMVASAPGQVEIVSQYSNGLLFHLRRLNGAWLPPAALPMAVGNVMTLPLRDPAATQIGNKFVVVYTDARNRLFGQVFDMETSVWSEPHHIPTQETVRFAPAIATSSDEADLQIEVVYVGQSGTPYLRRLDVALTNLVANASQTALSMQPETSIGGVLNAAPVLVVSGHRQLELFGRGTDDRLYLDHFVSALAPYAVDGRTVNPGWQGWAPITDNFFADTPKTNGHILEFSAAATQTGKTELAANAFYATKQMIFHNEYESERYGRPDTPWKTVHWRGWEAAGFQPGLGRPALVAVDTNFEIANIGNSRSIGPTVHFGRVAETNATSFTVESSPQTRTSNPVDPIVLCSGIGIFDTISIRNDGRPEHLRSYINGGGRTSTLDAPSGVTLKALSAASYGNGYIELVASASDQRVYHWRYRDGTWSTPVAIANDVASTPILIYTGAGQLELLGVNFDFALYRQRFVNNTWKPRVRIAANFLIDHRIFGPTAASSWGDGTIDLVVVSRDRQTLHYRHIGPGDEMCLRRLGCVSPRVFSALRGRSTKTPLLTAFSPIRLNVLGLQGTHWTSSWASPQMLRRPSLLPTPQSGLLWSSFEDMGSDQIIVSGTAQSGRRNFVAIAIRDGQLYINRNQDSHWTGFQILAGQSQEHILSTPLFLPRIAAHAD